MPFNLEVAHLIIDQLRVRKGWLAPALVFKRSYRDERQTLPMAPRIVTTN
jgi:hypothetical protein